MWANSTVLKKKILALSKQMKTKSMEISTQTTSGKEVIIHVLKVPKSRIKIRL